MTTFFVKDERRIVEKDGAMREFSANRNGQCTVQCDCIYMYKGWQFVCVCVCVCVCI